MDWDSLAAGKECPFDVPRVEPNDYWDTVIKLSVSTLCLAKNQAYRGQCLLIYDPKHVTRPDLLTAEEWSSFANDAHRAVCALTAICSPDHVNVASLGNQTPHLHWLIIPRYKTDPRWQAPVWMTGKDELHKAQLPEHERAQLIADLRTQLA